MKPLWLHNFKLQTCDELLHETDKVTIHVQKMPALTVEVFIRANKVHRLLFQKFFYYGLKLQVSLNMEIPFLSSVSCS